MFLQKCKQILAEKKQPRVGECTVASDCPEQGMCCSKWGFCGHGPDFCGPCKQDSECPFGMCCSAHGYCGSGEEYCGLKSNRWLFTAISNYVFGFCNNAFLRSNSSADNVKF